MFILIAVGVTGWYIVKIFQLPAFLYFNFYILGRLPENSEIIRATRNTRNNILAIQAALPAMPPKPRTPAMIAIIKNVRE